MQVLKRFFELNGIDFEGKTPGLWELYKKSILIALPATVEGALITIAGTINTAMVSGLGETAVAAVGLTVQVRMVLLILTQSLCVGTTAVIARRRGEEDRAGANSVLAQSMYLVTFLGIVMVLVGHFFARPLMYITSTQADTIDLSAEYFSITSLGLLFNCWALCLCAGMRGIGMTKITMVTNIAADGVNVLINFILIDGKFGAPALGIRGSAIAVVCGAFVSSVIAFYFAGRKDGYLRFTPSIPHFDKKTLSGVLTVGSSSIAESVFMRVGFIINTRLIDGLGTGVMAVYQIVSQVSSLSFTLGDGIAAAGAALVGQSLGAKRPDLAKANVVIARKLSLVASVGLMILILVLGRPIAAWFHTTDFFGVWLGFLVVVVGMIPQNGRVVYSGCLRGAGDAKYVALVSLISVAILRPILTYALCYPMNRAMPILQLAVTGPWIGFVVDSLVRQHLLRERIHRGKWLLIKL